MRFLGVGELGATASGLQGREVRVVAAVMNAVRQLGVVRVGAAASVAAVAGLLPGCRGRGAVLVLVQLRAVGQLCVSTLLRTLALRILLAVA